MHSAPIFHDHDRARLVARLRAHPIAAILANGDTLPLVAHAPVVIDDAGTEVQFHLSRAHALVAARPSQVRLVALGPHAYVSPDWYGVADQVPTINYLSVEIDGALDVLDAQETAAQVDAVSALFEAQLAPKPAWTRLKMSEPAFARMLAGIVGFRVRITRIAGVTKLNQNKTAQARAGVITALSVQDEAARAIAAAMQDQNAEQAYPSQGPLSP
jgi:transcriptional regulator